MSHFSRAAWRSVACLPLIALAVSPIASIEAPAQPAAGASASSSTPWLYRGSDVPHDKEWVFGEFPNGLRYAVRKNGVPPGQVSIRVRVDVGSLNERDDERGYAHFIEH